MGPQSVRAGRDLSAGGKRRREKVAGFAGVAGEDGAAKPAQPAQWTPVVAFDVELDDVEAFSAASCPLSGGTGDASPARPVQGWPEPFQPWNSQQALRARSRCSRHRRVRRARTAIASTGQGEFGGTHGFAPLLSARITASKETMRPNLSLLCSGAMNSDQSWSECSERVLREYRRASANPRCAGDSTRRARLHRRGHVERLRRLHDVHAASLGHNRCPKLSHALPVRGTAAAERRHEQCRVPRFGLEQRLHQQPLQLSARIRLAVTERRRLELSPEARAVGRDDDAGVLRASARATIRAASAAAIPRLRDRGP